MFKLLQISNDIAGVRHTFPSMFLDVSPDLFVAAGQLFLSSGHDVPVRACLQPDSCYIQPIEP